MIRHPPAATAVSQKDVDDLAAKHHQLLARIQARSPQQPESAPSHDRQTADGFSTQRQRRQQMSIAERLGL
ncbi:hypothetical protein IWW52_003611, partial [Coemansia sp. RSA 2704]